jgi:hypothetical protein
MLRRAYELGEEILGASSADQILDKVRSGGTQESSESPARNFTCTTGTPRRLMRWIAAPIRLPFRSRRLQPDRKPAR